jgi:hypothetical protein
MKVELYQLCVFFFFANVHLVVLAIVFPLPFALPLPLSLRPRVNQETRRGDQ